MRNKPLSFVVVAAGAMIGLFGATACGGSDDTSDSGTGVMGDGGGSGGSSGGGMTFDDCTGTSTPIFDGVAMACLDQATAEQMCKDGAVEQQPGTNVSDTTCGAGCTCLNCTQQMLDCASDPEGYCPTIVKCANDHNCVGVACYNMATCQTVIDMAPPCDSATGVCDGISSFSVALATAISDCVQPVDMATGMPLPRVCEAACP